MNTPWPPFIGHKRSSRQTSSSVNPLACQRSYNDEYNYLWKPLYLPITDPWAKSTLHQASRMPKYCQGRGAILRSAT
uniref:Uncharacterized protein n=1 Tax=Picea glauca TaxID=3330 RepID=A0A101M310_PICGL|nr:hypothetical protein ABT39_MTgene3323 [Picea glauca]QHR88571.1 hypothetical protein Q903MT_gene2585 [Picea sitchensis]